MFQPKSSRRGLLALAFAAALPIFGGCNDGGDGGGGGGDAGGVSSAVGVWMVLKDGGRTNWWQFNADGSMVVFRDEDLSDRYMTGTFRQDGSQVTGDFSNPGVGTGQIEGAVSADGSAFPFTFIEHWHTPYKRIPVNGVRVN